jgi:dTDP-glucose 4,6-dehydratase
VNAAAGYQPTSILVTGGAGFIGSNFVRHLVEDRPYPARITVYDALTYAGNLENLEDLEDSYTFVKGDICDAELLRATLRERAVDTIVHFAAESHVDRSILGSLVFTRTNVYGTHVLLEAAREAGVGRFIHISTDEVYGSLGPDGAFTESTPLDPTSPYAASKAASDLVVQSYVRTHGFPAIITRCSNNYGPYQFPEKLIPLMITNALRDLDLPVYGDGMNVREWIHTRDHSLAVSLVLRSGEPGAVYNIGSGEERPNLAIVRLILEALGKPASLIRHVADRAAHDRRYAIDSSRLRAELGWAPTVDFEQGMRSTIAWYLGHRGWWERVMRGDYLDYYDRQYSQRLSH